MHIPKYFSITELAAIHEVINNCHLSTLVTTNAQNGLLGSPIPLYLDPTEGEYGTLYGHLAKGNLQAKNGPEGEAMAIFMGPDAYISPSFYKTKEINGKVVPTWDYVAIHCHGELEIFSDVDRIKEIVTKLTDIHEKNRPTPWKVSDAPKAYTDIMLKAIVGIRMPISRIEASKKASQNKAGEDEDGVYKGLSTSSNPKDVEFSKVMRS